MIKKILFFIFICTFNFHLYFAQNSQAYKWVGDLFAIQFEDPEKAIEIGNKILKYPEATPLEQSYALIGIGTSYSIIGKPSKAIPLLTKAIEVAQKTNNYELRINSNLALANLYTKMNLHEQSYHYILKAQNEAKNEPKEVTRMFMAMRISTQLGQNLNVQKKYDASLKSLYQALEFAKKYGQLKKKESVPAEYSLIYSSLGETYYSQRNWEKAEDAFNKVVAYSEKGGIDSNFEKAFACSYLGKIYLHQKEYKRAIDTLQAAAKSNADKRSYIQADIYYTLSQAYDKIGDDRLASKYNTLYITEKGKISDEEKIALAESLKFEMQIANEQKEKRELSLVIFIGIIVSVLLAGGYLIWKLGKKRKDDKILFQKTIQKLEERLEERTHEPKEIENVKTKKSASFVGGEREAKLLQKLEKFEKSEAFLSPKVSLSTMASQFETNQAYVSELINTFRNKSFNQYINELRIEYICRKIYEDSIYQNYKISHLAELCGYPSHTAFTKIFKKVTGISPSVFIANAKTANKL